MALDHDVVDMRLKDLVMLQVFEGPSTACSITTRSDSWKCNMKSAQTPFSQKLGIQDIDKVLQMAWCHIEPSIGLVAQTH